MPYLQFRLIHEGAQTLRPGGVHEADGRVQGTRAGFGRGLMHDAARIERVARFQDQGMRSPMGRICRQGVRRVGRSIRSPSQMRQFLRSST